MGSAGSDIALISYASGSKTLAFSPTSAVALTSSAQMNFVVQAGTGTPVAPYVTSNLATFY